MGTVSRYGPTELATRATGGTIRRVGKESFGMLTGTYSKASGKTTRRMAMVCTCT
jgi:hypothetical protein